MTLIDDHGNRIDVPATGGRSSYSSSGADLLEGSGDAELRREVNTPRPFTPPGLSPFLPGQLLERPSSHDVVVQVSPACAQAWAALEAEVDRLQGALDALESDQRREGREIEAAIAAELDGQKVKIPCASGWGAKRIETEARARALATRARDARATYARVVEEQRPVTLAALVEQLPALRRAAQQAWEAAAPALRQWSSALEVADQLQRQVDPEDQSWRCAPGPAGILAAGRAGVANIPAWLEADHPIPSGSRFTAPDGLIPPRHAREAMWAGESQADAYELAATEVAERFAKTAFTQGSPFAAHFQATADR